MLLRQHDVLAAPVRRPHSLGLALKCARLHGVAVAGVRLLELSTQSQFVHMVSHSLWVSKRLELLAVRLVPVLYLVRVNKGGRMSHLANIRIRQENAGVADAIVAALVAQGAILSITTLSAVARAASSHVLGR
jgi:hypothetical protein